MLKRLMLVGVVVFVGCAAPTVPDAGTGGGEGGGAGGGGMTVTGGGMGGGDGVDAGADLDAGAPDAGEEDAGTPPPEPGGTSCDDAIPFDRSFYSVFEETPGYRLYGRFTVEQSRWISVVAEDFLDVDPAVSIFTADGGTLLAANDDSPMMAGKSSRIDFHPLPGTYCLRLEHSSSFYGQPSPTLRTSTTTTAQPSTRPSSRSPTTRQRPRRRASPATTRPTRSATRCWAT